MSLPSSLAQEQTLAYINATFDAILDELQKRPAGKPEIVLQRIRSFDIIFNASSQQLERRITSSEVSYSWPGRNADEAWRFTCVGKILGEIKIALESGYVITKRDIFYRDPTLFRNQRVVDSYIDDIAYTCKVSRSNLNVAASPHGLYAGLSKGDDTVYSISENVWDVRVSVDHLRWVLVVEKEATFKHLVEQQLHNKCSSGPGIIITGRGYPDLATLHFVQKLAALTKPNLTMFGLFDADPDGLAILNCYRYGSRVLAQESAHAAVQLKWLGVKIGDINEADLIPMTAHDRAKATTMLSKSASFPLGREHSDMLQYMLMLDMKAEIQALRGGSESLVSWLEEKMEPHKF